MTENKYKVPKAAWKKFGEKGRMLYNSIRDSSQQDLINPLGPQVEKKYWDVISHNFAFTAAMNGRHLDVYFLVKNA